MPRATASRTRSSSEKSRKDNVSSQKPSTDGEVLGSASRRTGRPRRDTLVSNTSTQVESRTQKRRSLSVDQLGNIDRGTDNRDIEQSQNECQEEDVVGWR